MRFTTWLRVALATVGVALVMPYSTTFAAEQVIEEIIVTARAREETLQDVPVTVAVMTEEDLDRYNISTLTEASKLVPNFQIFQGGSGNGSALRLRGIGSSTISTARWSTLSSSVGIPMGRVFFPAPGFAICTRRTAGAR